MIPRYYDYLRGVFDSLHKFCYVVNEVILTMLYQLSLLNLCSER